MPASRGAFVDHEPWPVGAVAVRRRSYSGSRRRPHRPAWSSAAACQATSRCTRRRRRSSSSSSGPAIAHHLARDRRRPAPRRAVPCLKLCSCRARYQAGWPASFGAFSAWLPSRVDAVAGRADRKGCLAGSHVGGGSCRHAAIASAGRRARPGSRLPSSTTTRPRIAKCPMPHSSSQRISYSPALRRREPQVRDHARHQVHLDAELRHGEVVQDVLRSQQHLDGLVERQVQLGSWQSARRPGRAGRWHPCRMDCRR